MEKYYMGISLTRWAIIQYCTSMWKRPEFRNYLIQDSNRDNLNHLIIPTKLRQHLNELILPLGIKNELKIAVGMLGFKIQAWFQELSHRAPDFTFHDCINHLHWTCYATVDRTQSIKSLYKAGLFAITLANWKILCLYCVEECVLDFWTKVSTNNEHNDVFQKIVGCGEYDVYINYWKFRVTHSLLELKEMIYNFDDSRTLEENMLTTPIFANYAPFRYFWNRLDEPKKQSICRIIDTPGGNFYGLTLDAICNSDIFMFVLQQLMIRGSEEMLNKITILPSAIPESDLWPHSNIFISAVHDFNIHDDNSERYYIMRTLLSRMYTQRVYSGNDSEARRIFYAFWKVHEFVKLGSFEDLIESIVEVEDIESLRYVIKNSIKWKERERIMNVLDELVSKKHYSIARKNREFCEIFIEVVQDLRDSFKKNLATCG